MKDEILILIDIQDVFIFKLMDQAVPVVTERVPVFIEQAKTNSVRWLDMLA